MPIRKRKSLAAFMFAAVDVAVLSCEYKV